MVRRIVLTGPPATEQLAANDENRPVDDRFAAFLGVARARMEWSRGDWLVVGGLYVALVALLSLPPLAGGGLVLSATGGDISTYWWWMRGYMACSIAAGHLPLINPFMMSGMPFLASSQSAVFLPANWAFLIFPQAAVLNAQMMLGLWGGMAAMHWLARRLGRSVGGATIAALVFGCTGFAIPHWWQGHLVFVLQWPLTPLAVAAWMAVQDRSSRTIGGFPSAALLWLPALMALQVLAGHPQIPYYTVLLIGALQVGWMVWAARQGCGGVALRGAGWLCVAAAVAGMLAAVQAVPTLLFSAQTLRSAPKPLSFYVWDSQAPADMLTSVAPWLLGGWEGGPPYLDRQASYWEVSAFMTVTAAVLVVVAIALFNRLSPVTKLWVLVGGLAWWLALGRHTFLYVYTYHLLPGMSMIRCPGRFMFIALFCLGLVAGAGADTVASCADKDRRAYWRAVLAAVGLLVAAGVGFIFLAAEGTTEKMLLERLRVATNTLIQRGVPETLTVTNAARVLRSALSHSWLVMAGSVGLLLLFADGRSRRTAMGALCAAIACECAVFALPCSTAFRPEWNLWPVPFVREIRTAGPMYRVVSEGSTVDFTQGMQTGLRHVWGYDSIAPFRYERAFGIGQGYPQFTPQWIHMLRRPPLLNAVGGRFLVAATDVRQLDPGWQRRMTIGTLGLWENASALPRARVVDSAVVVPGYSAAELVNAADFQPSQTVLLEEQPPVGAPVEGPVGPAAAGTVEAVRLDEAERFAAEVTMQRPGYFVLMDQMLDGWSASVDGREAHMLRANAVGRALYLPPGNHLVEMHYRAPGLREGALVSAVAWGAVADRTGVRGSTTAAGQPGHDFTGLTESVRYWLCGIP